MTKTSCPHGYSSCKGPLAASNAGFVCEECAKEHDRRLVNGVVPRCKCNDCRSARADQKRRSVRSNALSRKTVLFRK